MRIQSRIKGGATAALTVAMTLMSFHTVSATPSDSDTFVVSGVVRSVVPRILLTTPASGTFLVRAQCGAYEEVEPLSPPPTTNFQGCDVWGSGSYSNVVCGTGVWTGSMTIYEAGESQAASASYTIVFAGFSGVLTGTITDDGMTGTLAGSVQIFPTIDGDCVIQPAGGFGLAATITATY